MAQCITAIRTASSSWHSAAKVLLPTPAAGSAQSAAIFCQSPLHRLKTYKKPQLYFSGCQQWQYGDLKAHHLGHHVSGLVESRKSSVSKNLIIHQPHQSRHHKLNSHPVVASGLSTDIQHQGSNDDLSGYLQRVADCNVGQVSLQQETVSAPIRSGGTKICFTAKAWRSYLNNKKRRSCEPSSGRSDIELVVKISSNLGREQKQVVMMDLYSYYESRLVVLVTCLEHT